MFNKNEILKKLIEEYDVKTTTDIQDMRKDLFASTIHQMLEVQLDDHLGYDRYDNKNKNTKNSRKGYRNKNIKSDFGEITLNIPRDRNGDFELKVIRNYENDISHSLIDKITDRVIPLAHLSIYFEERNFSK